MRGLAVVLALGISAVWSDDSVVPSLIWDGPGWSEASDAAALCDIYSQQSPEVRAKLANWCVAPHNPCSATSGWAGVACAMVGGENRVVSLDASSKGLTGGLAGSIGTLGALTYLDLSTNSLSYPIPSQLGRLTNLSVLNLSGNFFTTVVPSSLCSLSTDIALDIRDNPGLTGLPACLTDPPYTALSKDANIAAGRFRVSFGEDPAVPINWPQRDKDSPPISSPYGSCTKFGDQGAGCVQRRAGRTEQQGYDRKLAPPLGRTALKIQIRRHQSPLPLLLCREQRLGPNFSRILCYNSCTKRKASYPPAAGDLLQLVLVHERQAGTAAPVQTHRGRQDCAEDLERWPEAVDMRGRAAEELAVFVGVICGSELHE